MKNKLITMSLLISALILPQTAKAFYFGASAGLNTGNGTNTIDWENPENIQIEDFSLERERSYSIFAGVSGTASKFDFRGELEYSNYISSTTLGTVDTTTAMFNGYVGLSLIPFIKPYIGFGIGYMKEGFDQNFLMIGEDWDLVPQYMGGLDIDLTFIPVIASIEYRYLDSSVDITSDDFTSEDILAQYENFDYKSESYSLIAKIRYQF